MAPASSIPPALPPSVEEAYRRKCIQLKQRTNEVEEANDAARLRLARLKRQVEKMRLERAFLLEQLARRTSTNVEDSDGSPSPPPTVSSLPDNRDAGHGQTHSPPARTTIIDAIPSPPSQPKDKPLRIKRGHRKPSAFPANLDAATSVNAATPGSTTFISQNRLLQSPKLDALSAARQGEGSKTNGAHKGAPKMPGSAFDLYCDETRPSLHEKAKPGDDVEEMLSSGWKELSDSQREEYRARADRQMAEYKKQKDAYDDDVKAKEGSEAASAKAQESSNDKAESTEPDRPAAGAKEKEASQKPSSSSSSSSPPPRQQQQQEKQQQEQEDVEMTNYDTDQETQGEKPEE
ncbi:hypothetical protein L209DRAFT_763176 [Thermothelomyces heterothallicus CBS 203.75]